MKSHSMYGCLSTASKLKVRGLPFCVDNFTKNVLGFE